MTNEDGKPVVLYEPVGLENSGGGLLDAWIALQDNIPPTEYIVFSVSQQNNHNNQRMIQRLKEDSGIVLTDNWNGSAQSSTRHAK